MRLRPANEKAALSVYALGRFPVTLHKEQWTKLLHLADDEDTAQPTDGSLTVLSAARRHPCERIAPGPRKIVRVRCIQ